MVSADEEASLQNPSEDASSGQGRDGEIYLLSLLLVIALYAVVGYGVYKIVEALT